MDTTTSLTNTAALRVRFFVRQADGTQIDYGPVEVATLAPGDSGSWLPAEARFQLDPTQHRVAVYDAIKFQIETAGVYAGELGLDAVSVQQVGTGVELAINGSFGEGHQQVATGDHAATFLDRLGGVAFWGSVGHHQSFGCAFCTSGLEPLVYFLRGLPLGDAVWFDESNNSGILYGDPLYSPVAVRLNPVNDTDTVSGVVELFGSTVNGRDPALVSTDYAIDVCPGEDFLVCDQQGTWQSTGLSGAGGAENGPLGSWNSADLVAGSYTLRLAVTSLETVTNRSQTLNDYYPVLVEAVAPPPDSTPPDVSSVQFSAATYSVAENGGSLLVTVIRTGGSGGVVSVDYASIGGIAQAGSDYSAVAGTLTFADGVTSQSFSVPILDDTVPEATERFILRLSNVTGASLGAVSTATVTISDNDTVLPAAATTAMSGMGIGDHISKAKLNGCKLHETSVDGSSAMHFHGNRTWEGLPLLSSTGTFLESKPGKVLRLSFDAASFSGFTTYLENAFNSSCNLQTTIVSADIRKFVAKLNKRKDKINVLLKMKISYISGTETKNGNYTLRFKERFIPDTQ